MGFGNLFDEGPYKPLFLLRCALRHSLLWATWSVRNGARAIYGPRPAVCFTEMPIAAFLETSRERELRGEAISTYALLLPKLAMYARGANPVIYGLDDRAAMLPSGANGQARIIPSSHLPEREQYRYVTYNPTGKKPIDWTHEREWRWPYPDDITAYEKELSEYGVVEDPADVPHLSLLGDDLHGSGVIVPTDCEARLVAHDILSLVDRQKVHPKQFEFIIRADLVTDLPAIRDPKALEAALHEATLDLDPIINGDATARKRLADQFATLVNNVEQAAGASELGEFGGCWLWIMDNTHELTRALLDNGRVEVSNTGRYLVSLWEYSDDRSLQQREQMTVQLAQLIKKKFEVECGYFSVLGCDDPNGLPFYCSDHLDNEMYYNKCSRL
ncbi:MAG: DUF4427 domain-containing protein [Synechococcales cyanobacterium]